MGPSVLQRDLNISNTLPGLVPQAQQMIYHSPIKRSLSTLLQNTSFNMLK